MRLRPKLKTWKEKEKALVNRAKNKQENTYQWREPPADR